MGPLPVVSLLNIIPNSLTKVHYLEFLTKYPKSHPHGGGPVRDCPTDPFQLDCELVGQLRSQYFTLLEVWGTHC